MALWHMITLGDEIALTYTDHPGSPKARVQRCGQTGPDARGELEAWVFDQAEPWDLCVTVEGTILGRLRNATDRHPTRSPAAHLAASLEARC